jgi:glycosyltransferase involved in cell wall biosynthesis
MGTSTSENSELEEGLPRVGILLATYNGATWVDEQIKSIFEQTEVDPRLYVFDDFSTDETVAKLLAWKNRGHAITVFEKSSERMGVPAAYYHLIAQEYVEPFLAFADQDDIWNPNHLSMSVKALGAKKLAIAISPREYINEKSIFLGVSPRLKRAVGTANAVIENIAYGNTIVMTAELAKQCSKNLPKFSIMHDSWIYLWSSVFAEVIRHENLGVRYRLHGSNQVGVRSGLRLKSALIGAKRFVIQDIEFFQMFSSSNVPGISVVKELLDVLSSGNALKRLKYCFSSKCYRQNKIENFMFKSLIFVAPKLLCKRLK